MPSPVGHLLGGTAVYLIATKLERRSVALFAVALLGSVVPDLDFLPGIMMGDMGAFHHGVSHSLTFAVLFGALVFPLAKLIDSTTALRTSIVAGLVYISHVLLDLIAVTEGTRGVPVLWPLLDDEFGLELYVFGHFLYSDIRDGIWSVVRPENIGPLVREVLILGSLVAALYFKDWLRNHVLRNGVRGARRERLAKSPVDH